LMTAVPAASVTDPMSAQDELATSKPAIREATLIVAP
jgi:hypothetical protein